MFVPRGHLRGFMNKITFLWETLKYQESRLVMVDRKAASGIAIEAGLFALVAFVLDKTGLLHDTPWQGYAGLAVLGGLALAVIVLMLQTIRPSRLILGLFLPRNLPRLRDSTLIWPARVPAAQDFVELVSALDDAAMLDNLSAQVYIYASKIERKYTFYRLGFLLAKVQALLILGVTFALCAWKIGWG